MVQSVEVPGEIMKTTIVAGLTLKELGLLFGSPMVLVLPSMYISQIPLTVTIGAVAICMPIIVYLIYQTPKGQAPIGWIGSMVNRRVTPDTYHIEPSEGQRADAKYLNVIHTADKLTNESRSQTSSTEKSEPTASEAPFEENHNEEIATEKQVE